LRARSRRLKHPVICPPLVPTGRTTAVGFGLAPTEQATAGYSIDALSQGLPHASGGHWVFAAGSASTLRLNLFPPLADTLFVPGRPVRTTFVRLAGRSAVEYLMPGYPAGGDYAGHVVVQWEQQGTTYQVSLHGYTNLRRAELMAEAVMFQLRQLGR
jgi:hypothetical protein